MSYVFLVGLASIVVGCALVSPALGFIVAGLLAVSVVYFAHRGAALAAADEQPAREDGA